MILYLGDKHQEGTSADVRITRPTDTEPAEVIISTKITSVTRPMVDEISAAEIEAAVDALYPWLVRHHERIVLHRT